ncbi:putative eotaxin-like isoform 4 [Scophthalmus maximus]|nr:eotaxin [Scophthalmus maximus]AWP07656.1 putative eotaxin-like isoform 4 [Scophthalmus maximus]
MASRVAALLLLGVICARFAQGEMVVDCCLSTTDKFFPLIKIETYTLQHAGQGCDLSATVFITKAARTVCIVHPSAENKRTKWVKSHIQYLDNKKRARK